MSKLRIFVQGENLYLFSNYTGLDPEVSKNYDARYMSDDNMNLPQPRTIRLGLNASF